MKIKRTLSILLSMILLFSMAVPVFATTSTRTAVILSEDIPDEIITFAKTEFSSHFQVIRNNICDFNLESQNITSYSIGRPFKLYKNHSLDDIYYFPIMYKQKTVLILTVTETNGEMFSSLGPGFSESLNRLYALPYDQYIIIHKDSNLIALSSTNSILLQSAGATVVNQDAQSQVLSFENIISTALFSETYPIDSTTQSILSTNITRSDPGAPSEWRSLSIGLVTQPNNNWCWAASSAMIINYKRATSLTAQDVVVQVTGSTAPVLGTWDNMKDAFNYWSMYPQLRSPLTYSEVKSRINQYDPVLMLMSAPNATVGHVVVLKGYETYSDGGYYIILDPAASSPTSIRAASTPSNVCYSVAGTTLYWDAAAIYFG